MARNTGRLFTAVVIAITLCASTFLARPAAADPTPCPSDAPCGPGTACITQECNCICVPFTPTPTPPPQQVCYGDCSGDGAVTIDELITLVNIALGSAPLDVCPQALDERFCTGEVFVDCILRAVNNALFGCLGVTPTPTAIQDCRGVPNQPIHFCLGVCQGRPDCPPATGFCDNGSCVTECTPCPTQTPTPTVTNTLPECIDTPTPLPDFGCDPSMCFTQCRLYGRDGHCHVFSPNGMPETCACDTEGPTATIPPPCQMKPTATPTPTPTCPPPPAGRTCAPFEVYKCVTDESGCSICDCCSFEDVGSCCQLPAGCFQMIHGSDYSECVSTARQGYVVSGCPIHASCNDATGRCVRDSLTTYRLTEGSTISANAAPSTPVPGEPLMGTLTVSTAAFPSPNTFFMLTIRALDVNRR